MTAEDSYDPYRKELDEQFELIKRAKVLFASNHAICTICGKRNGDQRSRCQNCLECVCAKCCTRVFVPGNNSKNHTSRMTICAQCCPEAATLIINLLSKFIKAPLE